MSPDGGTVYVTGDTSSALGQGAATFAYDAGTGKQLWVTVYVSGDSVGSVLTVAYQATGNLDE